MRTGEPNVLNNLHQAETTTEIEPMMNLEDSNQHGKSKACLVSMLICLLYFFYFNLEERK